MKPITRSRLWRLGALQSIAIAASLTAASPAHALCDGCVVAAVHSAAGTVTAAISAASTAITGAIATQTGAMTAAATYNNNQLITQLGMQNSLTQQLMSEAAKNTQDTIVRSALGQNMVENDRSYRVTNPCVVGATSVGVASAMNTAGLVSASNYDSLGRNNPTASIRVNSGALTGQMARAIAISRRQDVNGGPTPPPEVTAVIAASGACGSFVGSGSARAKACMNASLNVGNVNGYENADVRATTLVEGPRKPGQPLNRSIDMDPGSNEHMAFEAYRRNLSSPLEFRELNKGEAATDNGRRFLALRDAYDSRMALGEYPTEMQAASLKSRTDFIPYLRELLKADADPEFVQNYLSTRKPNWASKGISANEFFNLENERRYMNINWLSKTLSWGDRERSAEQLRVSALTNVLLLKVQEESRVTNLLLGAMLMSRVRQESLPEMKAVHAAAQK